MKISVAGIGQVGLRVCALFGKAGHDVFALDIDRKKIGLLNRGICEETDLCEIPELVKNGRLIGSVQIEEKIRESDAIIICVPTPLNRRKGPDLTPLRSVAERIAKGLKKNTIVVIESTTYPGIVENVFIPILEKKSGLKGGRDFYVACCSERINLGDLKYTITNIPRVMGAINQKSLEKAKKLYESALTAPIFTVSNIKTAAMVKLVENTFRDINIAFANELVKLTDDSEIDIIEVMNAAATKPFSFLPHYPGPGVGGECIPVSPQWLMEFARRRGNKLKLVRIARTINESMPDYVVKKMEKKLKENGRSLRGSRVIVLGLTYKENIKDTRSSPAKFIIPKLKKKESKVFAWDPFLNEKETFKEFKVRKMDPSKAKNVDCILLLIGHKEFIRLPKIAKREWLVFDTRNIFDKSDFQNYVGLGR